MTHYIPFTLAGIPCLIKVEHYIKVSPWRGSPHTCPSSDDYYGYEEADWEICDRKGYKAQWLAKKITPYIKDLISETISEYFSSNNSQEP